MFKFQKVKVYKSMGPDFYKRVARKQFMDRSHHQKYEDLHFGWQPVGNILAVGAVVLGGQTYEKVSFFASLMNLEFISLTTFIAFNSIQEALLFPTINTYFEKEILECCDAVRGRPVVVCGDGRCDSPGCNAKYCTYNVCGDVHP